MENNKIKKTYIEYLRVAAMIAVVLSHIGSTAASDFPSDYHTMSGAVFSSVVNLLHFAVPVFFMISGALMLNPAKEITIEKLVKKYILKYALVILVFGWGYAFIEEVFNDRSISLGHFVRSFYNMLQRKTWAHMWYLYALLGVLLLLPVLRLIAQHFSEKQIKYWICVCMIFLSVVPMIELWTGKKSGIVFPINREFIFYMLLGFWLEYGHLRIAKKKAVAGIVLSIPFLVAGAFLKSLQGLNLGMGEYYSPAVVIYSVCIFSLFKNSDVFARFEGGPVRNVVSFLSEVSFGVYLVHMFWINLAFKLFELNPYRLNIFVGIFGLGGMTLVLSVAAAYILKKIPLIKELV